MIKQGLVSYGLSFNGPSWVLLREQLTSCSPWLLFQLNSLVFVGLLFRWFIRGPNVLFSSLQCQWSKQWTSSCNPSLLFLGPSFQFQRIERLEVHCYCFLLNSSVFVDLLVHWFIRRPNVLFSWNISLQCQWSKQWTSSCNPSLLFLGPSFQFQRIELLAVFMAISLHWIV